MYTVEDILYFYTEQEILYHLSYLLTIYNNLIRMLLQHILYSYFKAELYLFLNICLLHVDDKLKYTSIV